MKSLENKKLIWICELLMEIYEWAGKKKTPAFKELMQRAHVNAMKNREKNFSEDAQSIYSHKEPRRIKERLSERVIMSKHKRRAISVFFRQTHWRDFYCIVFIFFVVHREKYMPFCIKLITVVSLTHIFMDLEEDSRSEWENNKRNIV